MVLFLGRDGNAAHNRAAPNSLAYFHFTGEQIQNLDKQVQLSNPFFFSFFPVRQGPFASPDGTA